MTAVLYIVAGGAILTGVVIGIFVTLVCSIQRAPSVPLSEIRGKREGDISRRLLVGFPGEKREGQG